MIEKLGEFLIAEELPAKGTTKIWSITATASNSPLGTIRWFSPWRRYTFHPVPNTLYDANCLELVAAFIRDKMLDRDPAKKYNPNFGGEKICARAGCGHPYYRHFDWGDNYSVGCKYCGCMNFKEIKETEHGK